MIDRWISARAPYAHRIGPVVALASFALGACSAPVNDANQATSNATVVPIENLADGGGARHGLVPLTAQDIARAKLPGELACGFAERGEDTLLYASGDVQSDEDAIGLIKVEGSVQRLTAPGGFDALVRGPTLTGSEARIDIGIEDGPSASGESPPRSASMTLARHGKPDVRIDGTWTCGP
ncbi:MAG: hypothetical protein PGN21_03515 [Sphingomonas paucimobilis]